MATTGALAKALGRTDDHGRSTWRPTIRALAAAEVRDYVTALPESSIEAVEIGNEPNIYNKITVYHTASGAAGPRPAAAASATRSSARSSTRSPAGRCR